MKKNLNVDAMILDLRNVQEDFLDRYEQIKLDCMIALTSPRVQTLLSQHNISLDSMLCKNVPEEVSVGVVNGKVTLSSASQTAAGQVLVVNGKLMITPDAAEVLQKYTCILVNGMIYCPQCLSAVVSARWATMPARSVSCSVSRPARSAAALPRYAIASKLNLRRIK